MKRTTSQIVLRQQLTRDVWRRILKLDNLEKFEESYALTQEWREWLLDPQINNNFWREPVTATSISHLYLVHLTEIPSGWRWKTMGIIHKKHFINDERVEHANDKPSQLAKAEPDITPQAPGSTAGTIKDPHLELKGSPTSQQPMQEQPLQHLTRALIS